MDNNGTTTKKKPSLEGAAQNRSADYLPADAGCGSDAAGQASNTAGRRPREEFPPFDDPAFSAKPAQPPVQPTDDAAETGYVGHAEFTRNPVPEAPRPGAAGAAARDDIKASDTCQIGREGNTNPNTQKTGHVS